jgi:hypothetical protein
MVQERHQLEVFESEQRYGIGDCEKQPQQQGFNQVFHV